MQNVPPVAIQQTLFEVQVKQCRHFEGTYELYITKCTHDGLEKNYESLREYVLAHLERRKQQKITDQASKSVGNAHASTPHGAAKREKHNTGECWQMKEKGRCSRDDKCPYAATHDSMLKESRGSNPSESCSHGHAG